MFNAYQDISVPTFGGWQGSSKIDTPSEYSKVAIHSRILEILRLSKHMACILGPSRQKYHPYLSTSSLFSADPRFGVFQSVSYHGVLVYITPLFLVMEKPSTSENRPFGVCIDCEITNGIPLLVGILRLCSRDSIPFHICVFAKNGALECPPIFVVESTNPC